MPSSISLKIEHEFIGCQDMRLLKVFADNPNERYIELAADVMRRGGIVIYPTDTLYALGCDALNNTTRIR